MAQKNKTYKQDKPPKGNSSSKMAEQVKMKKQDHPIKKISIKFLLLTLFLILGVYISDSFGLFNSDQSNDHTLRKWNSFYEFTERNNVDVLLIGNSHLYTGINPKNLSTALGANAFILASPGTQISDSYFSLKEALKRCKPGLVVIETYGIRDFDPYKLSKGGLSDQLKSFSARKDFMTKLASTPYLFSSDKYIHAWSNTIRNHDFIFTNSTQLKKNKEIIKQRKNKKNQQEKLYLGRYIRFTTGIEDSIMTRYSVDGPPVDGNKYQYNKYSEIYVEKIARLCEENGIEYMFLTLPMYNKHIKDYNVWREKISEILDKYPAKWLNMQDPYLESVFTPICFENTYNLNQHMTYQGSLKATYMLANFIDEDIEVQLTDRKKDPQWHNLFYGDEGYFENNSPHPDDKRYKVICKGQDFGNLLLKEVNILNRGEANPMMLTAKVDRKVFEGVNPERSMLYLDLSYTENGEQKMVSIPLQYDYLHTPNDHAIYTQSFKYSGIDFSNVVDARIEVMN